MCEERKWEVRRWIIDKFNVVSGIARGIKCARKLRQRRRTQRWADKGYKKVALGSTWKYNPFMGSSHAKGIVVEKVGIEAKQPNSATRKCVRVQLIKSGKKITAFVPRDGCLNYIDENDEVSSACRLVAVTVFSAYAHVYNARKSCLIWGHS